MDDNYSPRNGDNQEPVSEKTSETPDHAAMSQDDLGLAASRSSVVDGNSADNSRKRRSESMGDVEDILAQISTSAKNPTC